MVFSAVGTTKNLGLKQIEIGSNQLASMAYNNFVMDMVGQQRVLDKDSNSPPGGIVEGDVHIVGTSPTGPWLGHAGHLVGFYDGSYIFVVPLAGYEVTVVDEGIKYVFNGTVWLPTVGTFKSFVTKTASFAVSVTEADIYYVDATAGDVEIGMVAAASATGRAQTFKRIDSSANDVSFDLSIDGTPGLSLNALGSLTIHSDGTAWRKIAGV